MTEPDAILVAMTKGESVEHELTIVEGSQERACGTCHVTVWVAPSSIEILEARPDVRLCCIKCALMWAETHVNPVKVEPLSERQRAEVRGVLGLDT